MNCYEHTLIIKGDISETDIKKLFEKYSNIISQNSGKILKTEEWGLRPLSYNIDNYKKGFYFHIKLEGSGKTIEELEKNESIDKAALRFLTVRVKKHDLETNFFEKKEQS
tara:strand:- start:131 stop:460 length:330 start_codon:yes stop_codon:yes gene_type:complete